jgi:collagenase-like PrtC family protease
MQFAIHAGNLQQLKEALSCNTQRVRFGSEFCMYALPTIENLKTAYHLVSEAGKDFVYVTPRLADGTMDVIKQQLRLLDELGGSKVIVNDLGTIQVLRKFSSLKPYLGRQLVYTPSRCPWNQITEHSVSFFTKRKVKQIFYQTALNYEPTIQFYKDLGTVGADVDWIPEIFPNLSNLTKNELEISVHLNSIPVVITRKCHMARFLGEQDLENCSKPCYTKAYIMDNEFLKAELFLHGNTVFKLIESNRKNLSKLTKHGVTELVLTMGPLTRINSQTQLDSVIQSLSI